MKKRLIICPVDYSESTEPAISLAADLARANKSKVVLLHVIEPNRGTASIDESQNHRFQQRLRDEYLADNDVEFENLTRYGNPAEITVEFARQNNADLIVMGTHGRTGLAGIVVGSVAKKVMALAGCPVVTVKLPSLSAVKASLKSTR